MNPKKTIAFTINSLNAGGAERVVTSLANELINTYNVLIITIIPCESFYKLDSRIKLLNCKLEVPQNQNIFKAIQNNYQIIKQIRNHVKNESIDILIGFTTSVNVLTTISAKMENIPSIISERKNSEVNPPNKFWKTLRNLTYKRANYLVVQTNANKDFFCKIMPSHKIVIIRNPIASSLADKRQFRNPDVLNKTILTVGRLNSNKAQDLLIRAFSNVSELDDWELQIVGHGEKLDSYKSIAEQLGISNRVSFLGNITNVHDYYNAADIFVFTSKSEGYPNALAEALYFGVPSISTNCPHGPSDLITSNNNGILIEVDNQSMLEEQLKLLVTNKSLRHTLSTNAIERSKELEIGLITASWKSYINEYLFVE